MEEKKMVILKSKDGLEFKVESTLLNESGILSVVVEEAQEEDIGSGEKVVRIPCNGVRGEVLDLVIKFWKEHHDYNDDGLDGAEAKKHLDDWDKEFVKIDKELLLELLMASSYLESRKLLDFLSQSVANFIKDMTVEQVREYFGIEGDFSPEEEAKLREENKWAHDD